MIRRRVKESDGGGLVWLARHTQRMSLVHTPIRFKPSRTVSAAGASDKS